MTIGRTDDTTNAAERRCYYDARDAGQRAWCPPHARSSSADPMIINVYIIVIIIVGRRGGCDRWSSSH